MAESIGPILHVIVVGFHHKKGCQVEYSFPPMVHEAPNECPLGWKYLPTLALPDGSHNYDEDAVYFHLPSLNDPKRTIYGISCFRQIPVEYSAIKMEHFFIRSPSTMQHLSRANSKETAYEAAIALRLTQLILPSAAISESVEDDEMDEFCDAVDKLLDKLNPANFVGDTRAGTGAEFSGGLESFNSKDVEPQALRESNDDEFLDGSDGFVENISSANACLLGMGSSSICTDESESIPIQKFHFMGFEYYS